MVKFKVTSNGNENMMSRHIMLPMATAVALTACVLTLRLISPTERPLMDIADQDLHCPIGR